MVNRREFAALVGAGGMGSLLLQRVASAAVPQPAGGLVRAALDAGVNFQNIGQVRGLVQSTIPPAQRQAMAGNLRTIRNHYLQGQPGEPTAALQALQAQIEPWLPALADGMGEITGADAGRPDAAALAAANGDLIDWWSVVHFLSGFGLGFLGLDFGTTLAILILWEIIEPTLWELLFGEFDETLGNQIMDVIIGMLGWFLARALFGSIADKAQEPSLDRAAEAAA